MTITNIRYEIENIRNAVIIELINDARTNNSTFQKLWDNERTNILTYEDSLNFAFEFHGMKKKFNTLFNEKLKKYFKSLDFKNLGEIKDFCKGEKWNEEGSTFNGYKLISNIISLNMINSIFDYIKIGLFEFDPNVYTYCIISDFTSFLNLINVFSVDPKYITVYADSEFEKQLFKDYGAINIIVVKNWNVKSFKEIMKKFDIILGNPPYNKELDCQLLNMLIENKMGKYISLLHPIEYELNNTVQAHKDMQKNAKYCVKQTLIWGNDEFDIKIWTPLAIDMYDTTKESEYITVDDKAYNIGDRYYLKEYKDMTMYGKIPDSIKENIMNAVEIIHSETVLWTTDTRINWKDLKDDEWGVTISKRRGTFPHDKKGVNPDFTSLMNKDKKNYAQGKNWLKEKLSTRGHIFKLNSEQECINMENYLNNPYVRFFNGLIKPGNDITKRELSNIIWFDFSQVCDDEKICKKLKLTEETKKFIIEHTRPYYESDYQYENIGKAFSRCNMRMSDDFRSN